MIATTDKPVSEALDRFLAPFDSFAKSVSDDEPSWVSPFRKAGISQFAEQGFPTTRWEDWRFTNISPLTKLEFNPVLDRSASRISESEINELPFAAFSEVRLVFIDGVFSSELSNVPRQDGVVISNLKTALAGEAELIKKYLGQISQEEQNPFIRLNDAYFQDGVFIHVAKNRSVKPLVQILFVSTGQHEADSRQPRNLIIAEAGSKLTMLESYVSLNGATYFTNAVSEFSVGDNANVEHIKFQDESKQAFHLAAIQAELGRDSYFSSHSIALGAQLSRNNIRTLLNGEGLNCVLNGLYIPTGSQLADHHMIVDHAKPHCDSHEYFNGILDDRGRGVFHGRILVREDAQKTDAKQTNKSLLLSDEATTNTKPQLEIYADDVKCTHGATIGQLNEEAIFYLRARGISRTEAKRMLIHAFAGEILQRIQHSKIREEIDSIVWARLERATHV